MKITPIDERLRYALCLISNEVNDVVKGMTKEDFDDENEFMRLEDAASLLDEYCSCFGCDGSVAQRGEVPQVWNADTIFEPHRTLMKNPQLTFDWVEKDKESGEVDNNDG